MSISNLAPVVDRAPAARTPGLVAAAIAKDAGRQVRTKSAVIALSAGIGLIGVSVSSMVLTLPQGKGPLAGLTAAAQAHQILGAGFTMGLFAAAACAIAVVGDLSGGLFGAAVLRYPGRYQIVLRKAASAALVGLVFALVGMTVAAIAGTITAGIAAVPLPIAGSALRAVGGILLAVVAQAVIGSLLGWVVARSAPTVLLLIGWIAIGEPALMAGWPAATPYLLSGGAASTMTDLSLPGRGPLWSGVLTQTLWVAAICAVAIVGVRRRDVPANTVEDRS